jgi:HSP20 family protein
MATEQQSGSQPSTKGASEQNPQPGEQRSLQQSKPFGFSRRQSYPAPGPFSLMRRFSEDMDRLFSGMFGSGFEEPGLGDLGPSTMWPQIEVTQQGSKLIVQADVPGLKQEDVNVEVRDHELSISGERRSSSDSNTGGFYRSERSYGTFYRTIALPEGAKTDSASATFENGVLRIEIEAPSEAQGRGRRVEIRGSH